MADDDGDAGERLAEETVDDSQLKLPSLPAGWGSAAAAGASEDSDTVLHVARAALYVWSGEWKARGTGEVKVLAMAGSGVVRLLLRQEKTLKVRLNAKVRISASITSHGDISAHKTKHASTGIHPILADLPHIVTHCQHG